jgi:hypothetical protein
LAAIGPVVSEEKIKVYDVRRMPSDGKSSHGLWPGELNMSISNPCFNGDIINKTKNVKSDTSKLAKYLKNLVYKGYDLATIVDSLRQVYFLKNIDNLLIQLVGQTTIAIKSEHLYFIIIMLLFHVQYLIPTI